MPGTLPAICVPVITEIILGALRNDAYRSETERLVELRQIEAQLMSERMRVQKDVVEMLVNTMRHAFDRKLDCAAQAFNEIMSLIRDSLSGLRDEKRAVLAAETNDARWLQRTQRLNEIDREIAALTQEGQRAHDKLQSFLRDHQIEVGLLNFSRPRE